MVKKTDGQKLWEVTRKKMQQQAKLKWGRDYEVINGFVYDYPCIKKGHKHTIECITPEMDDALSEEAYDEDA